MSEPRLSSKARRKQKKGLTARPAPATTSDNADVASDDASDDGDDSLNVEGGAVSGEGAPVEAAADTVDTVEGAGTVEGATDNGAAVADDGNTTVVEAAPSELPTHEDLLALFDEFRREKRGAGQSDGVDVDFDAFADTILAESERLVAEHQCRGVRFEVAVAEGEVSLRPRLLR